MAYFSNSSEGMSFDDECQGCKYGQEPCPIALVQMSFNYEAVDNKEATEILDCLVKDDGTCEMKKMIDRGSHE